MYTVRRGCSLRAKDQVKSEYTLNSSELKFGIMELNSTAEELAATKGLQLNQTTELQIDLTANLSIHDVPGERTVEEPYMSLNITTM